MLMACHKGAQWAPFLEITLNSFVGQSNFKILFFGEVLSVATRLKYLARFSKALPYRLCHSHVFVNLALLFWINRRDTPKLNDEHGDERVSKMTYCPFLKKDIHHLERIQRAGTRWLKGLRGLIYEERLKTLKLQTLEKKKDKKRFGPDPQNTLQPNSPGSHW